MSHTHLLTCNISRVSVLLRNGEVSAKELAQLSLARIAATAPLNAFVTVCEDQCLRQAESADQRLKES